MPGGTHSTDQPFDRGEPSDQWREYKDGEVVYERD